MKGIILLLVFLITIINVNAAMAPYGPYCEHQGYTLDINLEEKTEYCIFDDKNKCEIMEFFQGSCGQEYLREFPCVKKGENVWTSFENCCEDLEDYIKPSLVGQPRCVKISFSEKILNQTKGNPSVWLYVVIFVILIGLIIYFLKRKRK